MDKDTSQFPDSRKMRYRNLFTVAIEVITVVTLILAIVSFKDNGISTSQIRRGTVTQTSLSRNTTLNGSASITTNNPGEINLTQDSPLQCGNAVFNMDLYATSSFTLKGLVSLGDKNAENGGGDGMSFFLFSGSLLSLGKCGGALGLGGLPVAFGFKLDTYYDSLRDRELYSADPSKFSRNAFGAFVNTQGVDSRGVKSTNIPVGYVQTVEEPAPAQIHSPQKDRISEIIVQYSGDTKTLTVVYENQKWSKNISSWLDPNMIYHLAIAGASHTNHNLQKLYFKSLSYTV